MAPTTATDLPESWQRQQRQRRETDAQILWETERKVIAATLLVELYNRRQFLYQTVAHERYNHGQPSPTHHSD